MQSNTPSKNIHGLSKGSYLLSLYLASNRTLTIGKLGTFDFKTGHYLYTGSAMGPGGLRARLFHHLNIAEKMHWHIDYVRRVAVVRRIWAWEGSENKEHDWAGYLINQASCRMPIVGFGSSDCRCPSHLFYSKRSFDQLVCNMGRAMGLALPAINIDSLS